MEINKEPNLGQKAKNFGTSMIKWAGEGFSRVSPEILEQRKTICTACSLWDRAAFNGTGKCTICGCSVGKLYIPSSRCPHNPPKWNPVSPIK